MLGKKMKQAIESLNFQEDDDTSRETFASETNEALASLDEPQEGHGETKLDVEEAVEWILLMIWTSFKYILDILRNKLSKVAL
ncbi:Phosphorylated adapter RNA export protein [Heterocephalus glaber]|uniref:Phosphorylated adapter RNA export protein n=1 Tax=Heterocephalus glaber TaxID=10181 RepID=G5ARM0_HETGA|nr:Phosphorylated adapter RNA export protein [Heterocephalus glaber]